MRLANSVWILTSWIFKLAKISPYDVIIIGSDPPFSALLFPILKFMKKGMLVHWCHDLYPEAIIAEGAGRGTTWLAQRARAFMQWAYRSVDLMVDIGPCMRQRLDLYQHHARSATLLPWALIEPDRIQKIDPLTRLDLFNEAKLGLLYSGNLGKAHDFSLFVRLARGIYHKDPKIIFCFACRGNRFKELVEAVRADDYNIRFAPFVEESELSNRLNAGDIHLLSLRPEWEGVVVPSKFFGALAVGKPVIYAGPEGSAIATWIKQFDIGLVLTENNLEEVMKELLELANNPKKLKAWQRNAHRAYASYFSKKYIMDQWDMLLREMLTKASPQGYQAQS